ncbi:MAG: rRNA adenine N-6-methyltransferase family protein, partial [Anaerolineales bacterium]
MDIPSLLKQFGLRPSKGLGQNFLQDEQALQAIVASADISPSDDVLEIGPGLGNLTRHLALAAHSVTSVELDKALFPALESVIAPFQNVRLVQGDILRMDPADLMKTPGYLVVANIPYYITSALL